jgi:hypothetical protein
MYEVETCKKLLKNILIRSKIDNKITLTKKEVVALTLLCDHSNIKLIAVNKPFFEETHKRKLLCCPFCNYSCNDIRTLNKHMDLCKDNLSMLYINLAL